MSSLRSLALLAATLVALTACSPPGGAPDVMDARGTDGTTLDAGADAAPMLDAPLEEGACRTDSDCDNGRYCDGDERCLGGRCQPGTPPCDDGHSCTQDRCDEKARACTHAPDHSMCGDNNACNGIERCDPTAPGSITATGCTRPSETLVECDDGNTCTVDSCDTRVGCVHAPRDLDGDGHVDRTCTVDGTPTGMQGDDCNDGDSTVFPGAPEMCADNRDNNCDGRVDFADTMACSPSNDTCASAVRLPGAGTYWGSTVGLRDDYALGCNTGTYADAVFEFTLTEPHDVAIGISATGENAAVGLIAGCAPVQELRCNRGIDSFGGGSAPSLRVHSLPAGTYRIVAETGATASAFRLSLRIDPPTPQPVEDICPAMGSVPALDLADGMPRTARLSLLEDDYNLSCNEFNPGRDAVYRLTVTTTSDVTVRAVTGTGDAAYVSFRNSPCASDASERRCGTSFSGTTTISQRGLAAGTYWIIVEADSDADVTVTATVRPSGPVPTYTVGPAPAGVAFIDICSMAGSSRVLRTRDDASERFGDAMSIPFPLRMYDNNVVPPITVSTNGWMSLSNTTSASLGGSIGDPEEPNMTIALAWADLYTRSGGICWGVTGTAPNRKLVVQWDDLHFCCSDDPTVHMTFEAIINEAPAGTNNTIDVIYQRMDGARRSFTAGIENEDGSLFTPISGPFTAPRALRLTPSM